MSKLEEELSVRFGRGGCRACIWWLCAGIFYGSIGTVAGFYIVKGFMAG